MYFNMFDRWKHSSYANYPENFYRAAYHNIAASGLDMLETIHTKQI
jgi:hypothetical protein